MARSRSILFAPLRIFTLTTNPCRLCPELDGYTDAECLRFASDMRGVRVGGLVIAVVLVLFVGAPVLVGVRELVQALMPRRSAWADEETWQGRFAVLLPGAIMIALIVWAAMLPYCLMLRFEIRKVFRGFVCRKCSYSLAGLPIDKGAIRCPECATRFVLADNGFPEVDPEGHRPEPRSPRPHVRSNGPTTGALMLSVTFFVALLIWTIWQERWLTSGLLFLGLAGMAVQWVLLRRRG